MKSFSFLLMVMMLSGCVSMIVQKEVQVRKDANGKVIETIEIERATQRATTVKGIQFDHLKAKEADPQPATFYAQ
jgi:hypothetical protein